MLDTDMLNAITSAAKVAVREELDSVIGDKRYINMERVPLICQSIIRIDTSLTSLQDNLTWGVRIVIGAVLVALLGMVLIK